MRREENQLDATEWFIALIICSKCFGHFYAHHQELGTICVLLPPMVCSAWLLVVGGQVQGSRVCVQEEGCCTSMPIIRSWRLYCVITAYGVQCLVAGCRGSGAGQQGVRPGRGMLHDTRGM